MGVTLDVLFILLGIVWLICAASLDINIQKLLWICGGSFVLVGAFSCRFAWLRIPEAVILFLFIIYQVLNLAALISGRRAQCPYAICVPGAQVRGHVISRTFRKRLDLAFEKYRSFKCRPYLIICGAAGSENSLSEAEAGADYLTARGVPCNMILQETRSFNTMDSFRNVYALLPDKNAPILIATSGWGVLRALWLTKLSLPLLRIFRHNGTNYPGRLALKVCPDFLHFIGKPANILAVTGTNGKTTVCNILCDMLEADGRHALQNRLGSNTDSGICTTLLAGCTVLNRPRFDLAVLEVDERCSPLIFPHVKPDRILISNLSRDSVSRNAHPQFIADLMSACISPESKLILNGDDPILTSVAPGNARTYFGIERLHGEGSRCLNRCNDVQICPVCAGKLEYEFRHCHHIGRVRCTRCSFRSADCDFELLAREGIEHIVVAGARAKDYRLRLLLAGVPDERIDCNPDALAAAEQLYLIPGQTVYVLYGTAFLQLSGKVRDKIIRLIQEQMK